MANQVATGAGKAFAYSTGAGGCSHLGAGARLSRTAQAGGGSHFADQEASDAARAFAYGTGAGGRSHLAKLRDGARYCNSALSLSFLLRVLSRAGRQGALAAPERIRSKTERLIALL